jgi:uncharacterized protein YndB with AHSA1/START domain
MPDPAATMRAEVELLVHATPERVFRALTEEIGAWWSFAFHPPSEIRLEARAGGRFYEAWDGGELEFAMVTRVQPGVLLALSGPMGLEGRVDGSIVFTFVGEFGGTRLTVTHMASGELPEEAEERYRDGWRVLLMDGLKAYVEQHRTS